VSEENKPNSANPYGSPKAVPPTNHPNPQATGPDATGGVIPYKNPHALISYYTGIFSCILPFLGLISGLIAVVLGIMGLKKRSQNPNIKGSIHAVVGICFGLLAVFIHGALSLGLVALFFAGPN